MSENLSSTAAVRLAELDKHNSMTKDALHASRYVEDVSASSPDTLPPDAPINWPAWKRNTQIIMVGIHSMAGVFMAAGIIPGYEELAEAYKISVPQASYLTSVQVC